MQIEFSRPRRAKLAIDMAPLIDVVFLLLVFFMLTSSFLPPAIPLDLPQTANKEIAPSLPIMLSLDRHGRVALNEEIVDLAALQGRLAALIAETGITSILLRGDQSVEYGTFLRLMEIARAAGAKKLNLVHDAE
jgi:biopolymer transport protein ExbD